MSKQLISVQFYVPRVNNKMEKIEYSAYREELLAMLKSQGVSDVKSFIETKQIDDICFEEELLNLKCNALVVQGLVDEYKRLVTKYHAVFKHNFYVYRIGDTSHTFCPE
ncbi:MAG: hypothetical protein J6C07_11695 [Lachnospiraceae bacterium]|nr:hypothetical protein [Lachnospiraceae bacterium]